MLGAYVLAGCDAICRLARGKFRAGKQALALLALGGRVQVCAVAHRFHAERGVEVDALRVQQALAEDARRAAHERAAADHGEAIVGREGFLVARAEAGSLEERIDDGRRGVVVDGEDEAQLLALREREVEVLVLVGRADVDEQVVRCARDGLRRRERIAGADVSRETFVRLIDVRVCFASDVLRRFRQDRSERMFHVRHSAAEACGARSLRFAAA